MKKILLTLTFSILASLAFSHASFWYNGINFAIVDSSNAKVTSGYTNVGSIIIPSSVPYLGQTYNVTSIGTSAFNSCRGITSINIPSSVTSIGFCAFGSCTGLTTIIIPSSVISLGDFAFYGCTGLTTITIPSSITSIGHSTFNGCTGLTSISIPSSVTSIGDYAFISCVSLATITISSSVTSIGRSAFMDCAALINVESNNNFYSSIDGVLYNKEYTILIQCPLSLKKGITIPSSVTSIGDYVFFGCKGLTSIIIPSSVTTIGKSVFAFCTGLISITIPSSITSIGESTFDCCTALSEIRVFSVAPLILGSDTFFLVDTTKCTLYVPTGSLNAYKSADQWKAFLNIVEFDATGVENPGSESIKVYPNPIIDILTIDFGSITNCSIRITNLLGQTVYSSQVHSRKIDIDMSKIASSGLYYLQVIDNLKNVIATKKLLKK